jgi:Aspartate/tyrosine/aromatic aminotransferase
MKYSSLVKRIAGESAEVWDIHEEGRKRLAQGEDVIMLSIGEESDQTTPASIQQEAVDSIRRGRNHYTPVMEKTIFARRLR